MFTNQGEEKEPDKETCKDPSARYVENQKSMVK